jgi:AraC-like DNA-binding protein
VDFGSHLLPYVRWACRTTAGGEERQLCDHLLILGASGSGVVAWDEKRCEAGPGSLFLLPPRAWYSFQSVRPGTFEFLAVHFDWRYEDDSQRYPLRRAHGDPLPAFRAVEAIPGWQAKERPFLDLRGRPRVHNILEDVIAAFGRADDLSAYETSALFAATLVQIEREARLITMAERYEHVGADALRRVEQARQLLEAPGSSSRSIAEIAEAVGWSPDHLGRMCRLVLGVPPLRVRRSALIRRAKDLLTRHDLPVNEIASLCGCADPGYFGRLFKAETGMAPDRYRSRSF